MQRRDEVALHYEIGRLRQCAALAHRLGHERLKDTDVDYDAERDREALTQRYAKRSGLEPLLIAPTADILPALLGLQGRDHLDRRFNQPAYFVDRGDQTAQPAHDLLARRPTGRAQDGSDHTSGLVEHHDRLKAILIVMRIEQAQLLAPMDSVKGVVHIKNNAGGWLLKAVAIVVYHGTTDTEQSPNIRQVFEVCALPHCIRSVKWSAASTDRHHPEGGSSPV